MKIPPVKEQLNGKTINRVLFIANSKKIGGGNKSLISIIKALRDLGIKSHVIVPGHGEFSNELLENKIKFSTRATQLLSASKLDIFLSLLFFSFLLLIYKPDIVHANDVFCFRFFGKVTRLFKIPIVCHIRHFIDIKMAQSLMDTHPDYLIYNSYYNLIKTNEVLSSSIFKHIPNDVAYNFFNIVDFYQPQKRTAVRSSLGIKDEILISLVGNINPLKGHIRFIQSLHLLLSENPNLKEKIRCIIVGEDVTNSGIKLECEELTTKLKLTHLINFTGFVNDIPGIYSATDILLIPSEEEPFGRVAVEGILSNKQIVASNSSGLKEILEELSSPYLFDFKSETDMASKIKMAIETYTVNKSLILQDQNKIKLRFEEETQVKKLIDIYESLSA